MGFIDKYLPFLLDDGGRKPPRRSFNEIEKELADKSIEQRALIAKKTRNDPDMLAVLAEDKDVSVRRAVAGNKSNTGETNVKLARDKDDDVRLILAKRLATLLPELSPDEQSEIYALTVHALGILAEDSVTNIRVALASSLKDIAKTPPKIARRLAEDAERQVSEPILRFGVCLPDEVLIDIIASQPMGWKVKTIAQRKKVTPTIAKSILETGNAEAGTTLINNDGADITQDVVQYIITQSKSLPEWDQAMIKRNTLPRQMKRKMAIMIDNTVRQFLKSQAHLDAQTTRDVIDATRRRIDWAEDSKSDETPMDKLKRLLKKGAITEEHILDALSWSEHEFVILGLSAMAKINPDITRKMLSMNAANPTVSLCWRAGLSMRSAIKIQQHIAKVPHQKILLARDGSDYPLSVEDMIWQLEFFGVKAKQK